MDNFLEHLDFNEVQPGFEIATYAPPPMEVQVVRLQAGTSVGNHTHTGPVKHLVLSGRVKFGEEEYGPMVDYEMWRVRVSGNGPKRYGDTTHSSVWDHVRVFGEKVGTLAR